MTGERIREKGYVNIDAFDPSKKSLLISQAKGAYKNLFLTKGCPKGTDFDFILVRDFGNTKSGLIVNKRKGKFWIEPLSTSL